MKPAPPCQPADAQRGAVLHTTDPGELDRVQSPDVQAVIYTQTVEPPWMSDLAEAVAQGRYQVPRTILHAVDPRVIEAWLETQLPRDGVGPMVWQALRDDILSLLRWLGRTTGGSRFIFRVLTGVPSRHCGYHVDTVPPGAPAWGVLRVYNGAGTHFVHSDNLRSTADFYRYVRRRERLIRDWQVCGQGGDVVAAEGWLTRVQALDAALPFLHRPEEIHTAAAGSVVAFKHLDVSLYWSNHAMELAWIHCSPMEGVPRLLVNIAPATPWKAGQVMGER